MKARRSSSCPPRVVSQVSSIRINSCKPSLIALGRDPAGHLEVVLALLHLYVLAAKGGHRGIALAKRFNHDDLAFREINKLRAMSGGERFESLSLRHSNSTQSQLVLRSEGAMTLSASN